MSYKHRWNSHKVTAYFETKESFELGIGYRRYHREDGPAVEFDSGHKEYYLYGRNLTEQEFNEWQKRRLVKEAVRGWL